MLSIHNIMQLQQQLDSSLVAQSAWVAILSPTADMAAIPALLNLLAAPIAAIPKRNKTKTNKKKIFQSLIFYN